LPVGGQRLAGGVIKRRLQVRPQAAGHQVDRHIRMGLKYRINQRRQTPAP